jgi:hypothetical protein
MHTKYREILQLFQCVIYYGDKLKGRGINGEDKNILIPLRQEASMLTCAETRKRCPEEREKLARALKFQVFFSPIFESKMKRRSS